MKRALITGITGQDGSYLAELLLDNGYQVYGLVRRTSSRHFERIEHILDRVTLLEGDLLDMSSLMCALQVSKPDEVYNLAAMSHVGLSFTQPVATMEVTGLGATRLLEAIRIVGLPGTRYYQASTSEIIGQSDQGYYMPKSPYAASKLYAHWTTANYRDSYGMYACSGVLYNHESPRRGLDFVTRKITNGVARIKYGLQDTIELGNLNACRDWGYAADYVEAMYLMLQQDKPEDFVIASGETHSIQEFLTLACDYAGLSGEWEQYITVNPEFYRPNDVGFLKGDSSKAAEKLGWKPSLSFKELVALMVQSDLRKVHNEYSTTSHHRTNYHSSSSVLPLQAVS